jgi:hypothetical protein
MAGRRLRGAYEALTRRLRGAYEAQGMAGRRTAPCAQGGSWCSGTGPKLGGAAHASARGCRPQGWHGATDKAAGVQYTAAVPSRPAQQPAHLQLVRQGRHIDLLHLGRQREGCHCRQLHLAHPAALQAGNKGMGLAACNRAAVLCEGPWRAGTGLPAAPPPLRAAGWAACSGGSARDVVLHPSCLGSVVLTRNWVLKRNLSRKLVACSRVIMLQ